MVLLAATPAAADPDAALLAGYAFRSAADGRNHGASASLGLDVPIAGPFSFRPEGVVLGFGGSAATPASLGMFAGALSLVYRFDDTDARAIIAIGPLAGLTAEGDTVAFRAGALASLGLRFPVLHALDVEARVALPAVLWGPQGFAAPGAASFADGSANDLPLQTTFSLGIVVDPGALFSEPDPQTATTARR